MNTRRALMVLGMASLSTAQADNGEWGTLGNYLAQACTVGKQVAGRSDKLDWICNVASSYTFVNDNVLNGDWTSFGTEVMGKYVSQSVDYLGKKLGFTNLNTLTSDMNTAMQGSYNGFKGKLFDAMTRTLKAQAGGTTDDNAGLSITTPGGLADFATRGNPFLASAQTAGRTQQTLDSFSKLLRAAQAKKITDQSTKAIESALTPAMKAAVDMIGTPLAQGYADAQVEKGKTALSQREVLQLQLEMQGQQLKQDASMKVSEFQLLTEIAKQGVLTNTQLISKLSDVSGALDDQNNVIKQAMEEVAGENLDAAVSAARQYSQYVASYKGMLDPRTVQAAGTTALGHTP